MSMQLQSKVLIGVLDKIEPLTVIKNEPPESEIVEIGIDDIFGSSDEESIPDIKDSDEISSEIKDIEIVLHELSEDLIKSETVSENILENNHTESVETQIFVKSENNPFINTENITQSEHLNETENTSDGNVNRGTDQGLIEVQDSNEHFNEFGNQTDKQLVIEIPMLPVEPYESPTLTKAKHAFKKIKSTHKQNKKRYDCEKCMYTSEHSTHFKIHQLTHKTKTEIDDRFFKYRCDKCKYKSYWCNALKVHKLLHLKPEEIHYFYCYHCSYKSKHKGHLQRHILSHFKNEDVPFHCYICDFTTLKRNLIIEHFKKHPKHYSKCDEIDYKNQFEIPYFYCYHCSYKSTRKGTLKIHIFRHFERGEIPFHCYICDFVTLKRDLIIEHFKKHPKHHSKCDETEYKNQLEIPYFYCYHWSHKYRRKDTLRTHIFRHFERGEIPFHCYICDFVTLKRDLIIEHFKKHPKHHSKCDETDYKNQLQTYTKKQMSSVDKKKKYRCDKCKYKTYWCNNLKAHKLMHLKPEEIQYFYCYHCSYKSKQKSIFRAHIVRHFKNEDVPFHCYMCDFITLKRDLIIEHFKTHPKHHSKWNKYDETEYKYRLETCNKRYYSCKKCAFRTYQYVKLKRHELTHKTAMDDRFFKYRCNKCKYKTSRSDVLKIHKLIHLKPEETQYFYCYHCSYKSNQKSNLKTHIFRHFKREKIPFHCCICDFVTRKRESFKNHLKQHKKDKTI